MRIGMIGLGRMGAAMAQRLLRAGHECVVFDLHPPAVEAAAGAGAIAAASAADLVAKLAPPRAIWLMVPAAVVDGEVASLAPLLEGGDILIDGGNSHYHDDIRRAAALAPRGIRCLDVGTSGGVWGRERGYCLMVGGEADAVEALAPVFEALAPGGAAAPPTPGRSGAGTESRGWLHCGASGAGHFVKMVHNGIEYGLMAAYAEGFNILRHAGVGLREGARDAETTPLRNPEHFRYELDLGAIAELWRRGSVVASWLLDLVAAELAASPDLSGFAGRVSDSGEGRWTVQAAVEEGVPAPVLSAALYARFSSRGNALEADRLLAALRHAFGGHREKPPDGAAG